MVLLAFLPTELLSIICRYLEPEDFISFYLLNRRFQAIAEPFKKHHCEQWRKYAVLQDRPNSYYWFWHNVLQSVLRGWEGAKYVRTMNVGYSGDTPAVDAAVLSHAQLVHDWDPEEHEEVQRPNDRSTQEILLGISQGVDIPTELRQLIIEAIKDVPWLSDLDFDQLELEIHKTSFVLALLIFYLPNLRRLAVARYSSPQLYLLQRAVSHVALDLSSSPVQHESCKYIRQVDFTTQESEDIEIGYAPYGIPGDFEASFLLPFFSLPSIQSVKAGQVVESIPSPAPKSSPSKVSHISFQTLDLSANTLSSILAKSANLRICELSTKSTGSKFSVAAAIDVLVAHASNTLSKLVLHTHPQDSSGDQPVSFKGFKVLRHLDITYDTICSSSMSIATAVNLAEILPESLEMLEIQAHQFREGLAPAVLALLADTRSRQPNLEYLALKSWLTEEDKETIWQACQMRNIRPGGDLDFGIAG